MNSLFVASLLFLGVLLLNPSLTTGKRSKVPKVRCYKVYNAEGNCRKRIKGLGRITFKDCCESGGGVAYQVSKSKRGKKKCLPCTTEKNWSAWEGWTKCNSQCGPGISRRTRRCLDINNKGCPGSSSEKKQCFNSLKPNCPVHGSWSDWGNWSSCSVSCGQGRQLRFRSCSNPKPQHGGRDCQGVREDKRDCMDALHCPVHGEWGSWGPWSSCTVTCSIGWNERKRKCDNPKPRYDGLPCKGDEKERRSCDTYTKCDGVNVGSGSGDFSGSSGDGSGSGSGGASGSGVGSVLNEGEDDDDGSAGSGQQKYEESTIKSGSDFDFSKPTDSSLMADSSNDGN